MKFRHFYQKDEYQVVDLWNKTLFFDNLTVGKFRKQLLFDDNFDLDLTWVCEVENKIVGFIAATKRKFPYLERGLEPNRAWINVIFVDEQYQRQGIGTKLVTFAEKALQNREITVAAYSPGYFFWGIDKDNYPGAINFFEKLGYHALEEHYSMKRDLHGFQIPENILAKKLEAEEKGYKFINFDFSYSLELLDFMGKEFGAGWKKNALDAMKSGIAPDVITMVVDKNNKICGACNRAIDGNIMRIGPMGIAKDKRNSGIGTILFTYSMYEMSRRGIYHVYFVTTDEPGKRYYLRQGLEVVRTTVEYRKNT